MSEQIDQFCDNLKTRLNAIEKRLLDAKAALDAAPQQAKQALESRVAEVRTSLEERRHEVEAMKQRATSDLQRAVADGKQKVEQWKAKREHDRLVRHAEHSEEYAKSLLLAAALAVEEAEMASLEALAARKAADDVSAPVKA